MKDLCVKLSGIGALLICLPVIYRIHEGDRFNPASYFLWSALSVICVITLIRGKKGGYMIMGGYVLSDFLIGAYAYIKSGRANFGWFEWFIIGLTAFCATIYLWCESRKSFRPAVIINGIACIVAGIPLLVETFEKPHQMSYVTCGLYTCVSSMGYYGERSFNGKFIPGLSIIYWIVIIARMLSAQFLNL